MTSVGLPSTTGYVVRRTSCRPMTSAKAPSSALTSSAPRSKKVPEMLYEAKSEPSCSRNHSRSCAYDSGSDVVRGSEDQRRCANDIGAIQCSLKHRCELADGGLLEQRTNRELGQGPTSNSIHHLRREERVTSEVEEVVVNSNPPRRLGKQCAPDRRQQVFQRVARRRVHALGFIARRCGRARQSILRVGVRGNASSTTNADGTMYSGNFSFSRARSNTGSSDSSALTMYATRYGSPGTSSRATATASRTPELSVRRARRSLQARSESLAP